MKFGAWASNLGLPPSGIEFCDLRLCDVSLKGLDLQAQGFRLGSRRGAELARQNLKLRRC